MASFVLAIMFLSLLPSLFAVDFSNSAILGISVFTLLYTLADTPLIKSSSWKGVVVLLSCPVGLIVGFSSYINNTSEIEIVRVTNSTTLMALGLMICALTFNENSNNHKE